MLRFALSFALLLAPTTVTAQEPATASVRQRIAEVPTEAALTPARARQGEQVFILFNSVSPDKRAQFEAFIAKFVRVMQQAIAKDPALQAVQGKTRILYPAAPARDGRWVYVFLMDPVVPGVEYDMDSLMRRVLSRDETTAMMQAYFSSLEGAARRVRES